MSAAASVALPVPLTRTARSRATSIVVALVVVVAVLALYVIRPVASGGSSAEAEFAADWRGAVASYAEGTRAVEQSAQAARGSDVGALLAVYRQLHDTTTASLAEFRALEPPGSAEAEYDAFLAALEGERSALKRVIAAAETSDTASLPQQIAALATALGAVVEARAEVDAAVAR